MNENDNKYVNEVLKKLNELNAVEAISNRTTEAVLICLQPYSRMLADIIPQRKTGCTTTRQDGLPIQRA